MGFYMLDHPNPNTAQGVHPRRGGFRPSGTAIMHTSESVLDKIGDDATAEDCAAFIGRRTDYGCYHDLVDSNSIIEMYPFEWETWQDSETNNWAVGISAACRTTDWATMPAHMAEGFYRNLAICAADFVKYMKEAYNITVPLIRINGAQARARVPGFCAHGDSGISRSDPGVNFDWARFFRYTKEILDGVVTTPVKKEEKMLYIATDPTQNGKVWIGDGLLRYHIPDPSVLQHYKNVAGPLNVYDNANIQQWAVEVLGIDIATLKQAPANVTITAADITSIANSLKATLAPGLAAELAKRLAE